MNRNMTLAGLVIMTMLMLPDCQTKTKQDKSTSTMEMKLLDRGKFQTTYKGKQTDLFTLKNSHGMVVQATNYGGKIQAIIVPDKDGEFADVCFGYESIEECLNGDKYFGALIGRFGNRIAGGKFTLDGVEYTLPQNNGPNTLHGGESGFDDAVWDAEELETSKGPAIRFSYLSVDGEQGFPGNLRATVTYTLTGDNELIVDYHATTDKATVVNMTQHAYFNLAGHNAGEILDHVVVINADRFIPVDENLIPTGELRPVEGTPFDFREPHAIGERINSDYEQIVKGLGYDHCFVLNKQGPGLSFAASAWERESGRLMEVFTTQPGMQLYTGNFLTDANKGKEGAVYDYRNGFCMETQHFPDSPNQPDFPSTVLEPGEEYIQHTIFKFSVRE